MIRFDLTIVRHGETNDNLARILSGQTNTPLNQTGDSQATAAGKQLADSSFDLVLSSDLIRAARTATLILEQNNHPTAKRNDEKDETSFRHVTSRIETNTLLRERCFGCYEGQPFSKLKAEAKAQGKKSLFQLVPEGGETDSQVQQRCDKFLKRLFARITTGAIAESDTTGVLVVSHGGFIRHLMIHMAGTKKVTGLPKNVALGCAPNAGISKFSLIVSKSSGKLISGECTKYYFKPYP